MLPFLLYSNKFYCQNRANTLIFFKRSIAQAIERSCFNIMKRITPLGTADTNGTAKKISTQRLVLIALITAVTCILAPFSIPIPISPVPISLTNLVLLVSIYILGWKDAVISFLIYLLLGTAGLPVFSGFTGGLAKLAGPTGGYLVGFIFMVILAGLFVERFAGRRFLVVTGMILGTAVAYIFGTAWLAFQMDLSFTAALSIGVIPYLPGDTAKIIIAVTFGPVLRDRISLVR